MLNFARIPQLSELRLEQTRRKCQSYHGFIETFWNVIEPATPFSDNWHVHVIADHLEAAAKRQIRKLLINIPPRCGKSISVAVMYCPWIWGVLNKPFERFLYTSYSGSLSARDSRHSRKIIASEKYKELFGERFEIRKLDKDTETHYENDHAGYRMATSVGGVMTGEGGSFLISDDLHKSDEAQSDAIREGVLDWYRNTYSTRLNNPATDIEIVVMQRLHEMDMSGYILSDVGGFEHICIPMSYDGVKRKTSLGFYDPRKKKDELLWPERFPKTEVELLSKKLGVYGASGQLQQDPAPTEGGIIPISKIKKWPSEAKLPVFDFVLQSYDTAYTEKTMNDYTAMLTLGIFEHKGRKKAMLLDAWHEKLEYPDLRKRTAEEHKAFYGEEHGGQHGVDCVLIEDKGSGMSLRQDLNRAGLPVRVYNPGKADKTMRAHRIAPLIEAGLFYIMESPNTSGQFVKWALECVNEWRLFPNAKNDDFCDALSQALIYLQDVGFLVIDIQEEVEDFADDRPRPRRNPYNS